MVCYPYQHTTPHVGKEKSNTETQQVFQCPNKHRYPQLEVEVFPSTYCSSVMILNEVPKQSNSPQYWVVRQFLAPTIVPMLPTRGEETSSPLTLFQFEPCSFSVPFLFWATKTTTHRSALKNGQISIINNSYLMTHTLNPELKEWVVIHPCFTLMDTCIVLAFEFFLAISPG